MGLLDIGHKIAITGLIGGSLFIFGSSMKSLYGIRQRRLKFEKENPNFKHLIKEKQLAKH